MQRRPRPASRTSTHCWSSTVRWASSSEKVQQVLRHAHQALRGAVHDLRVVGRPRPRGRSRSAGPPRRSGQPAAYGTSWLTVARNLVLAALASTGSRSPPWASVVSSVMPCTPTTSSPHDHRDRRAADVDDRAVGGAAPARRRPAASRRGPGRTQSCRRWRSSGWMTCARSGCRRISSRLRPVISSARSLASV